MTESNTMSPPLEEELIQWAERYRKDLESLSTQIHEQPELSGAEHIAANLHMRLLRKRGFFILHPFLDLDTAFWAEYDSGIPGPSVAYLAEYDALPGIGHGCGHNLLGAVSTVSGIALSRVVERSGGRVVVVGCPAEETNGAKVRMASAGVFENIDAAMLAHPYKHFQASGSSAALEALRFEFYGREAHAADSPEAGVNALAGVLELFQTVKILRNNLPKGASINGVITHGGTVANLIPKYACAEFHLRGRNGTQVGRMSEELQRQAKEIAAQIGARVECSHYEADYQNMVTNQALSQAFLEYLRRLGREKIWPSEDSRFSLDMGNVSQVCPAIHPYFDICGESKEELHTEAFCACAVTKYANEQALTTVKALALTGLKILQDSEFLRSVKEEFYSTISNNKGETP